MSAAENDDLRKDYERLRTLYSISKQLSISVNIKDSFTNILACASYSFPILSAILIEHWEKKPRTHVWYAEDAAPETVAKATLHAKNAYSYIAGASAEEAAKTLADFTFMTKLIRNENTKKYNNKDREYYITMPLIIDHLPALGVLQLEGAIPLDEKDLEFVQALTNLVSVALDRYYKDKREHEFNRDEMRKNVAAISTSRHEVANLETERALREAFVTLLTHDLNTPISVIKLSAELILRKDGPAENCYPLASKIIGQTNRVTKMISDLLDANHIRSGEKLALKFDTVNLNVLAAETISELGTVHGDRFIFKAHQSIVIWCDPSGVKRIIENLCNNAIKYGFSNTPVIISLEKIESDVQISVQNSGEIIPVEDQELIFQQFRRTGNAIRSSRAGWGIGLTLVQGVAEAHGGSVKVKSDPDNGTIFTVTLPKGPIPID